MAQSEQPPAPTVEQLPGLCASVYRATRDSLKNCKSNTQDVMTASLAETIRLYSENNGTLRYRVDPESAAWTFSGISADRTASTGYLPLGDPRFVRRLDYTKILATPGMIIRSDSSDGSDVSATNADLPRCDVLTLVEDDGILSGTAPKGDLDRRKMVEDNLRTFHMTSDSQLIIQTLRSILRYLQWVADTRQTVPRRSNSARQFLNHVCQAGEFHLKVAYRRTGKGQENHRTISMPESEVTKNVPNLPIDATHDLGKNILFGINGIKALELAEIRPPHEGAIQFDIPLQDKVQCIMLVTVKNLKEYSTFHCQVEHFEPSEN